MLYALSPRGLFSIALLLTQAPDVLRSWGVPATKLELCGDLDGDGQPEILAGNRMHSTPERSFVGIVRVLASSGTVLRERIGTAASQQFGTAVAALGDVDGDGIEDYLCSGGVRESHVFSGRDGTILVSFPPFSMNGLDAAPLGDVDGDGIHDFLMGVPNRAHVLRGGTFEILRTLESPPEAGRFGYRTVALGDVDADGFVEFAIAALGIDQKGAEPGQVYVFSGRAGELLYRVDGIDQSDEFGRQLASPGDVTGDGVADLAVGTAVPFGTFGRSYFFDGQSGASLGTPTRGAISYLAAAGDVDGNGFPDLVLAADSSGARSARVVEGKTRATLMEFSLAGTDVFDVVAGGGHDWNDDGFPDFLVGRSDRVELRSGAPARTEVLGRSCGTVAGRAARIGATGAPVLGQSYALHLSDVPPHATAVLRIGALGLSSGPRGGTERDCAFRGLLLAELMVTTEKIGPSRGAATVLVPMPADPALVGQRFSAQWTVLGSRGQALALTRILRPEIRD
jgi:hypothetical protein